MRFHRCADFRQDLSRQRVDVDVRFGRTCRKHLGKPRRRADAGAESPNLLQEQRLLFAARYVDAPQWTSGAAQASEPGDDAQS
ncbi:MAG TPA: hypothetical protein VK047_14600, partial [Zeimonas sp.]|nr:hypothetical protein [Zeimonas sp.]